MSDLISRQEAIDAVEESRRLNHHQDGKEACAHEYEHRHFLKILMELPPAQPEPEERRRGKWVDEKINPYTSRTYCSECGNSAPFICVSGDDYGRNMHGETKKTKFCPNCGANMEVE